MQKNNYKLGALKRKLGVSEKGKLATGVLAEAASKYKMKSLQAKRQADTKMTKKSLAIRGMI